MIKKIIIVNNKHELKEVIKQEIELNGLNCDLNHIDVSLVKDMADLFYESEFNGDISKWNTSNVSSMDLMFSYSQFDRDISQWNVSEVHFLSSAFYKSSFSQDLSLWKPIKVEKLAESFNGCMAPIPYWAQIKDIQERQEAIKAYQTKERLDSIIKANDTNYYTLKI